MKPITRNNRTITDQEIQTLADEAETGIDIPKRKRRPGRPSLGNTAADVFPVRLDPELRAALGCIRLRATGLGLFHPAVSVFEGD